MTIISFFCLLIFLFFLISGLRKNSDLFSPGRVFGMLWSFVFGLSEFKFSRLQSHWTGFEWFMALCAIITFLLGNYISFIINLDKPYLTVSEIRLKIRKMGLNEHRLFNFIIVYFFIYLISFIIEWQIVGFIPLFTSNPAKARLLFEVFGLSLIVGSANVILFLIIQYFIFFKTNIQKKILFSIIAIFALGNYILIVQRYGLFILMMMIICLIYYSGKKIKIRTIVIFGIIIVVSLIGIQSLRETKLGLAYILLDSKMKLPPSYAEFSISYMYIVMNVENFVRHYSNVQAHSYGFFTFDFLTALTGIKHWIENYFLFDKFKWQIAGYNTYPFYWAYYYDFGIMGLAIIPFAIGFIISEVYNYLHRNPNVVILSLYSVAFAVITISFSSDPLTRLDMMFNFVIIILAQIYIMNKVKVKMN